MKRSERIKIFVEEIWKWFDNHKRILPWRDLSVEDDTQRAYMVMVSEVMLQQTQVERVKIIFKRFVETFPTLHDLAAANNKEVILAWRGMGYNSRALRLRDAAKHLVEHHSVDGSVIFPTSMAELQKIPGVGHYTAAAIRNFAFSIPTACLDTNIRRILHRTFYGPEFPDGTWKQSDDVILKVAEEVLEEAVSDSYPDRTSADWHAALMDFGSLVCTKTAPKWDVCPLTQKGICKAAYKVKLNPKRAQPKILKEPGRHVGSTYIPNRIFRGKAVEELRDAPDGLTMNEIGKRICIDWSDEHKKWLQDILKKLIKDQLIVQKKRGYVLAE